MNMNGIFMYISGYNMNFYFTRFVEICWNAKILEVVLDIEDNDIVEAPKG
jgi:hypothetical protein